MLPNTSKGTRLRPPHADAEEDARRIDMHVIARCVNVFCHLVTKLNPDICFVGRLVFRKTGVAIDSHQRSAHTFGNGGEMGRNCLKRVVHGLNKLERDVENVLFVTRLVFVKPFTIVIFIEIFQELQGRRFERGIA